MNPKELQERLKQFGLNIIRLLKLMPNDRVGRVVGDQILRSGTSAGANYRAACRARSRAEFVAKLGLVEEELDETLYWLEVINGARLVAVKELDPLTKEGSELLAIIVASKRTAKGN